MSGASWAWAWFVPCVLLDTAIAGGPRPRKIESCSRKIEPPPRVHASECLSDVDILVARTMPLLRSHGYVLLDGLEEMTAREMSDLVQALAGPAHLMLRFDGANCVPGVPEVRVLGKGHSRALLADIGYEWHQDGGGSAPFLTLLHCKEPCEGADTLFADGAVLFNRHAWPPRPPALPPSLPSFASIPTIHLIC